MKKLLVCVFGLLFLSGCTINPTINKSAFDGSSEVGIAPHGTECDFFNTINCISIGYSWTDRAPDVLKWNIVLMGELTNIAEVLINIDGEIIELDQLQAITSFDSSSIYEESRKSFASRYSLTEELLSAGFVAIKVIHLDGSGYTEGILRNNGKDSLAISSLQRFITTVEHQRLDLY